MKSGYAGGEVPYPEGGPSAVAYINGNPAPMENINHGERKDYVVR